MGDLDHRETDDEFLTAQNLARFNDVPPLTQTKTVPVHKDNVKKSGLLTDEKLKSIMSFLDEVEMADRVSEFDNIQVRRIIPGDLLCHQFIYYIDRIIFEWHRYNQLNLNLYLTS